MGGRQPIGDPWFVPAVYQLLGFPGTGKYTVGRSIVEQLGARNEPTALLDNHATANLVWSLVPTERQSHADVMRRIRQLRNVVLDAAAELTSPDHSIVFTNFLPPDRPPTALDPHRDLARQLGRQLVAVVLHRDEDEVLRRVPNADRAERMKLTDPALARTILASGMTVPTWPDLVELDITGQSPTEAAARVIALADGSA